MYKDLDYSPESYASAVNYANRLNGEMESAKSECLGILSGLNPPADLDISGEVSSLKSIIESMSTRVGEIRTTIEEIRNEIESRDANIASQLEAYINNEKAYVHNTEKARIEASKPDPKDYADGVNDEAYIKDLEKYNKKLAAYEAFSEGKIDYNYLKSTYGEEIAKEIQSAYGKQYSGWQEGEGKSIVEGVSGIATTVKDAAVLLVTDPVEFYVRTEATITNAVSAGLNGMLNTVENAVDLLTAVGGAVGSGVASWTGHEETSKKIRENTSSFISTEWVDKAYDKIYSTAGGKWLDSKSVIKYDSQIFNAIADIGKTGGLIGLSIVASPAVGALVAGASAGGETIEKDFQNMGGTVTDVNAYNQALIHGLAAGALEGGMWYAGSKVGLSGDLALSVADPVARTGVQMISPTENRSFKEIFNEDYGGAKGIMTNMAFSILGNKFSDRFSKSENIDIDPKLRTKKNIDIDVERIATKENLDADLLVKTGLGMDAGLTTKRTLDPDLFTKKTIDLDVTAEMPKIDLSTNQGKNIDAMPIKKFEEDWNLNKAYVSNPEKYVKQGISYEEFASKNGIEIKEFQSEIELAKEMGDKNWYLVQVIKDNEQNMTPDQLNFARDAYAKARSELDTNELMSVASPFLTKEHMLDLDIIDKHPNMANLSPQNKNTLHQFQRAGGCEINGMLRGKDYPGLKWKSFYDIEMEMNDPSPTSGYRGANAGHSRTISKDYSIVDEIDDIIKNNANTTTIKGVSYLDSLGPNVPTGQVLDIIDKYGDGSPQALQALNDLIGLDITDKGYNSKTIPPNRNTSYSFRFNGLQKGESINNLTSLDVKVESYISPGCGAYIDTCGGIKGGLGEMLIKRDCTQHIIDAYVEPNTNKLVLVTLYT